MKSIIGFGLILFFSNSVFASETLSLEQVIEKVKTYSQELKLKLADKQTAGLEKKQALGSALPQISFQAAHNEYLVVPSFGGFQLQGNYELQYGLTVKQALLRFGAVGAALKAAKIGNEMVDYDIVASKNNATYVAKAAYYQILLAQRNLEINQNLLRNAQDNMSILRKNFSGGRPPQGDLIRLQADIENKKPLVQNALADLTSAKMNLNILMGEDPNKDLVITGGLKLPPNDLDPVYLQNLTNMHSPSIKMLEKNLVFRDKLADVEWANTMPKLDLLYSFSHNSQSFNKRFDDDRTIKSSMLGLQLSWNIWDGGVTRANYQKSKVNVSRSEVELQKTKDQFNNEILSNVEKLNGYKKNVSSYESAVSLARKSFQLSQNRFRAGKTAITELNDTQSLLLQSELQQARNLYQMNLAYALIENLVGTEIKK
jgi:outer membrane protein